LGQLSIIRSSPVTWCNILDCEQCNS